MGFYVPITTQAIVQGYALEGRSPDVLEDRLRSVSEGSSLRVLPRVIEPENGPLEQLSTVEMMWANDLIILPAAPAFTAYEGTGPGLSRDGVFLARTQFLGGGYLIGDRHYVEEGVFSIVEPLQDPIGLAFHDSASTRSQLRIVPGDPVRFELVIADAAGVNQTHTFAELEVAMSSVSIGVPRKYHYYHFSKHYEDPDTIVRLSVDGVAATPLVIPGLSLPDLILGDQGWGTPASLGTTQRNLRFLWMRAGWSEAQLTGTIGNDPWSDPRIFETAIYEPHGDYPAGRFDSGSEDYYWHTLQVMGVENDQGSKLEIRPYATNAPPNGSLTGLWDDCEWIEVVPNKSQQLNDPVEGFPRGRYLYIQIRYTPSPSTGLAGGISSFGAASYGATAMLAFAVENEPGDEATPITIGASPVATKVLPVTPQFTYKKNLAWRTERAEFDYPYTQTFPVSTRRRGSWGMGWSAITDAERDTLDAFFEDLGAEEPFFWTPLDSETQVPVTTSATRIRWLQVDRGIWASDEIPLLEVI